MKNFSFAIFIVSCSILTSNSTPVPSEVQEFSPPRLVEQEERSLGDENDEKERAEFVALLNAILWDADTEDTGEERQFSPYRRKGLLGRPMPQILKRKGTMMADIYDEFTDTCYGIACMFGINKLASQISRMLG